MELEDSLKQIEKELCQQVRYIISKKYNSMFYTYILVAAEEEFKRLYAEIFRRYLRDVSARLQEKIAFAGINLAYVLKAHMDVYKESPLANIQALAVSFIQSQLEGYFTWNTDLSKE